MFEATLESAKEYASKNNIEEWVYEFFCGEGNNKEFLDYLKSSVKEYTGPMLMGLDLFKRCHGPEPGMEFSIPQDDTEQIKRFWLKINGIKERYETGNWDMPPLIVRNCTGEYEELSDGNHRFEALKMLGVEDYWVILYRETIMN